MHCLERLARDSARQFADSIPGAFVRRVRLSRRPGQDSYRLRVEMGASTPEAAVLVQEALQRLQQQQGGV